MDELRRFLSGFVAAAEKCKGWTCCFAEAV